MELRLLASCKWPATNRGPVPPLLIPADLAAQRPIHPRSLKFTNQP